MADQQQYDLDTLRHSCAHLLAQAVKQLYPETQVTIGPVIEDGFYYDFFRAEPFVPEDLKKIEKRMKEIAKKGLEITRQELPRDEAIEMFRKMGEPFKIEIIEGIDGTDAISTYTQGDFTDLCRGPHVDTTKRLRAFKLLHTSSAYWRGDERNPVLQRIYGTAWNTKEELKAHLDRLEEAKKRDHRKLGKELDLYTISDVVGPGLILWHPKGGRIRYLIEEFWKQEHYKNGYELVYTPHVAKVDLWEISGHMDFYKDNIFSPMDIEGKKYIMKPMNCPFHIQIYKTRLRSYRDLPLRWAELGTVYRYERSGVMHGLLRVRGFTQDDAHLFCRPDQIEDEISTVLEFVLYILRAFGFDQYKVFLSTRPDKSVGSDDDWDTATQALQKALEKSGLEFAVDPGEGVFYGPKIDIKIKDSLHRYWQVSTIQVDFNLPQRFKMTYIGDDGQPHQPIMIHRALMGSLERFFGCLIEHYAGAFPAWLAPVQVILLPITDNHHAYVAEIAKRLTEEGIRVEKDLRNEKIGYKIREAQLAKIPYMIVLGDQEVQSNQIAVRRRKSQETRTMSVDAFLQELKQEIEAKTVDAN
ncbi:MAG: threonine--tRNA ligase [Nitrospina sp.]|nr:MAG: threonine--tRNA ligase [Nitrospina sp.]